MSLKKPVTPLYTAATKPVTLPKPFLPRPEP